MHKRHKIDAIRRTALLLCLGALLSMSFGVQAADRSSEQIAASTNDRMEDSTQKVGHGNVRFGSFLSQFNDTYPGSTSGDLGCQLCHAASNGGEGWNAYGWEILQNGGGGAIPVVFGVIASLDSDGNGDSNLDEINANAQPGWCDPASAVCVNLEYDRDGNTTPATAPSGILLDIPGVDTDGDGIDDSSDNCTLIVNADQRDTNADGYGNACDPDLDNNGVVNFLDISLWVPFFNTACGDVDEDFTGEGGCNFGDYALFPLYFMLPPGPSGLVP